VSFRWKAWPSVRRLSLHVHRHCDHNVIGNSITTVVTAKICGEFDGEQSRRAYAKLRVGESVG